MNTICDGVTVKGKCDSVDTGRRAYIVYIAIVSTCQKKLRKRVTLRNVFNAICIRSCMPVSVWVKCG